MEHRFTILVAIFVASVICIGCNSGAGNGDAKNDAQMTREERDAAKAALKELNKLGSYTEAGINYQEYQSRVLDAKGEIDNHLLDVSSCPVKVALTASLDAYVDAREFWGLSVQRERGQGFFRLKEEEMARYSKYGDVASKDKESYGATRARLVEVFWIHGAFQAKLAEELLSK